MLESIFELELFTGIKEMHGNGIPGNGIEMQGNGIPVTDKFDIHRLLNSQA